MVLLLLLTFTLLSSYFHPGSMVNAQQSFKIQKITLSIEPSATVSRGTNVTLKCKAVVITSGQPLSREYTILKDDNVVYKETIRSSEDFLYLLPEARASHCGRYKCKINIQGDEMLSRQTKLIVEGVSEPFLDLTKSVVDEGEELKARCTAPGETGAIQFFFYDNSDEIRMEKASSNQAEIKLSFATPGIHKISCTYTVSLTVGSIDSKKSNEISVSVNEVSIKPVLKISPEYGIFEGDLLKIVCSTDSSESYELYLSQGTKLLRNGNSSIVYSVLAMAEAPERLMFECRVDLRMRKVEKFTNMTISVTELFSVPTLTMSPAEVFQNESMTLTCHSERVASERLQRENLVYTLQSNEIQLNSSKTGVFSVNTKQNDLNYTCAARAASVQKVSKALMVRPKVLVSTPKISIDGKAFLTKPVKILCESDTGSLPINYTLMEDFKELDTISIKLPNQKAHFMVYIKNPEDINKYTCEARNHHDPKKAKRSENLSATVIVPLTDLTLSVVPDQQQITEEDDIYLICKVKGTPPITFKWYQVGKQEPLNSTTTYKDNNSYRFPARSGKYYCEASNQDKKTLKSNQQDIQVHMAQWKKALIGGVCLLVASVLILVAAVLYFKSKRGKREAAAELSVKPSSPKSDDSLTVNLTHDTEVYNADTVRVDGASVSVWSERKPEADNSEVSSKLSSEGSTDPDVEYTEVVHARSADPARVPLKKGTDTVYSELQNSPYGAADHHDYGSVEYAELNGEHPEISQYHPGVNGYQDLPEPVD